MPKTSNRTGVRVQQTKGGRWCWYIDRQYRGMVATRDEALVQAGMSLARSELARHLHLLSTAMVTVERNAYVPVEFEIDPDMEPELDA